MPEFDEVLAGLPRSDDDDDDYDSYDSPDMFAGKRGFFDALKFSTIASRVFSSYAISFVCTLTLFLIFVNLCCILFSFSLDFWIIMHLSERASERASDRLHFIYITTTTTKATRKVRETGASLV